MSGSKARLDAIDAVKNYDPPEKIFPPAEAPGKVAAAYARARNRGCGRAEMWRAGSFRERQIFRFSM